MAAEGQPNTTPTDAALVDSNRSHYNGSLVGDYGRFTFSLDMIMADLLQPIHLDNSNSDVAGLGTGDRLVEKLTLFGDHDNRDSGKVTAQLS